MFKILKTNTHEHTKQHGRTLLEMLGVLAIIGVLSITALVGFTYAMNKHRANETIYDVMLRGTNVPMIDEYYYDKAAGYEFRFPGLVNNGRQGTYYPMTTKKDSGSSYYVEATGVTYRVCELILKMNPTDIDQIVVGNSVYTGDSDICGTTDGLAMKFCFGSDGTICDGTGHGGSSGGSGSGGSSGSTSGGSGSGSGSGSSGSGTDPDACDGIDCGLHGVCNNGVCDCTDGYSGIDCNIPPDPCADVDCGAHGTCENGSCVCSDGYTGTTCQDPPTCTDSGDCPSGLVCKDGVCGDPDCTESADCSGEMICVGGLCVPPECTGDDDCADNQQCQDGQCVDIDCDTNPTLPYCICKDSGNYDCCMAPSSSEACVRFCVTHPENCVNDPCPNDENTDPVCCALLTDGGFWGEGTCCLSSSDSSSCCSAKKGEWCNGDTCCEEGTSCANGVCCATPIVEDCPDPCTYMDVDENGCPACVPVDCPDGQTCNPDTGTCEGGCKEGEISCGTGETSWCCDETNICGTTQGECCADGVCCSSTLYCWAYNNRGSSEPGKCNGYACASETCTPFCLYPSNDGSKECYSYGACCVGTIECTSYDSLTNNCIEQRCNGKQYS